MQMYEEQCRLNASLRTEMGSVQTQLQDIRRMLQLHGPGASAGADDGDADENNQRLGAELSSHATPTGSDPDARV